MPPQDDIRIGTLVPADQQLESYLRHVAPLGFESFQLTFGQAVGSLDPAEVAAAVRRALEATESDAIVSALGVYGNPLVDESVARDWERLIDAAESFGAPLVCGFTGRLPDRPVPDSIPKFRQVFGPLARRAEDRGVRLAFENCAMGGDWHRGDWNIAHGPRAWEMMFDAVDSAALGLEWEPCHQLVKLTDPLPQLRDWLHRVFHLHGKDATVHWDLVRRHGVDGSETFAWHRTPGFGDTNWTDVISILRMGGFRGAIDIEGWHDPVYQGELEMTGQVRALEYLRACRGGEIVANPT